MDDVLPPCGGYIPVLVDEGGYIKYSDSYNGVVHRETRDLHRLDICMTFSRAKQELPERAGAALLELTSDGGGASVWVRPDEKEAISGRLARFKGCYGSWPVRTLEI